MVIHGELRYLAAFCVCCAMSACSQLVSAQDTERATKPQTTVVDPAVKQELERQQGNWAVVSSVRDGQEADPEITLSIQRIVAEDRVVWERDGKPFSGGTLVILPELEPCGLEIIPDGGPARGERVLGIYKWDHDELIICMADLKQPRPTKFSAGPGRKTTLMRFTKVTEKNSIKRREPDGPK